MFKEIKRNKKLYMLIVEQVEALIEEGVLKPGDRLLSERDLANQLGLSRSSVREAIAALEIMGVVDIQPGLGTFISSKEEKEDYTLKADLEEVISPTDIFEARHVIEPKLARFAALRATAEDLEQIREILEKSEALEDNQFKEFEELDEELHLAIAKSAYNEVLYQFAEGINKFRHSKLWGNMKLKSIQTEGRISKYKKEHREIYEALIKRNVHLAETLAKRHVIDIQNDIFEEL